jgi:hypothetical protein
VPKQAKPAFQSLQVGRLSRHGQHCALYAPGPGVLNTVSTSAAQAPAEFTHTYRPTARPCGGCCARVSRSGRPCRPFRSSTRAPQTCQFAALASQPPFIVRSGRRFSRRPDVKASGCARGRVAANARKRRISNEQERCIPLDDLEIALQFPSVITADCRHPICVAGEVVDKPVA